MAETASCYICTWAWRRYRDIVGHREGQLSVHHTTVSFFARNGELSFMFFEVNETSRSSRTVAEFKPQRMDSGCKACSMLSWFVAKAPGLPNAPRSGVDVNIDFQQARAWLRDCYLSHPECQGWRKQRTLPTRLVHVRRVEGSPRIVAKVCPSEKLPATTTYLSLSHCWGDFKFLTTTRSNLAQFELQLPVKSLSRTIQDAMLVTLEMEFEYIWIDSLCIIQDSAEDWAKEASLMGEVYHNASCNISASAVPNGEHGFILPRVFDPTPILAQVNWSTDQVSDNAGTVCESHCFIFNNPRREIARGPLFKRAWT